jgi:hypothetical protein
MAFADHMSPVTCAGISASYYESAMSDRDDLQVQARWSHRTFLMPRDTCDAPPKRLTDINYIKATIALAAEV